MERTIDYKGIEFEVEFDYQPFEKQVRYSDDGGHEGCPQHATLNSIYHKGVDFTEFLEDETETIEEKILEQLNEY